MHAPQAPARRHALRLVTREPPMSRFAALSDPSVPWEQTLRRDIGVGGGMSSQTIPAGRILAARSALATRLQSPGRARAGSGDGRLAAARDAAAADEVSRLTLGLAALKDAVRELTAFVFDEFEATATHLHQQSLFIKELQMSMSAPNHATDAALEESRRASERSGRVKDALSALVGDMNRMSDDLSRLEQQQREKFDRFERSFEAQRADMIDMKRATSAIDALKDTQRSQSHAAIQQRIDALRRCDPPDPPAGNGGSGATSDVLAAVSSMVDDKVTLHVSAFGQRVEHRVRGVEARLSDLTTRVAAANDEAQTGKASVREALQALADSLDIVCPSI